MSSRVCLCAFGQPVHLVISVTEVFTGRVFVQLVLLQNWDKTSIVYCNIASIRGQRPYVIAFHEQIEPRENEGTEREAPGLALGIYHVHESYF